MVARGQEDRVMRDSYSTGVGFQFSMMEDILETDGEDADAVSVLTPDGTLKHV